jgi:hypothetical protein
MISDDVDHKRSRPIHPMYYDREMLFAKDRSFWLGILLLLLGGMYAKNRYQVEIDRWHMWARKESLEEMPAHHFHNRGGILIKKQFAGFEKYHKNQNEVMTWFTKSYPDAFPKKD